MKQRLGMLAGIAALGAVLLTGTPAMAVDPGCISGTWVNHNCQLPAEDVARTKHNFFKNNDVAFSTTNTTEVCVFCHTPHGGRPSDTITAVPLWNRAMPNATDVYKMYDSPNFDGSASWGVAGGKPLGVSLACLSCHDGTVGIDSLINAPGSGGFIAANKALVSGADTSMQFHATATLGVAADGSMTSTTRPDCNPALGDTVAGNCFQSVMGPQTNAAFFVAGMPGAGATFGMAPFPNLTQNLSDDHPISMQIPDGTEGTTVDLQFEGIIANYNQTKTGGVTYLSRNTNTSPGGVISAQFNNDVRDRIRAYPSRNPTSEYVECASCHNPHTPRPLFLRLPNVNQALTSGGGSTTWNTARTGNPADTGFVSNNPNFQSAICLSCHEK